MKCGLHDLFPAFSSPQGMLQLIHPLLAYHGLLIQIAHTWDDSLPDARDILPATVGNSFDHADGVPVFS